MKLQLIIYFTISSYLLSGQSSIGLNETYVGAYGLQHEINIETKFSENIHLGLKVGSNFKDYSSYKMGLRYSLINISKASFRLGVDLGHLQYVTNGEEIKKGYRTLEFNTGIQYIISKKLNGLLEIGIMNKEISSDPTPIILRIGLGYNIYKSNNTD